MEQQSPSEPRRKRNKVRGVWISFTGRIIAQLIGAIATVTLGIVVLGNHEDAHPTASPTVLVATQVRTNGETVIVLMPPGKDGQADHQAAELVARAALTGTPPVTTATEVGPVQRQDAPPQTPTYPPAPQSGDLSGDSRATPASPRE